MHLDTYCDFLSQHANVHPVSRCFGVMAIDQKESCKRTKIIKEENATWQRRKTISL
jgi:hypothetical protein